MRLGARLAACVLATLLAGTACSNQSLRAVSSVATALPGSITNLVAGFVGTSPLKLVSATQGWVVTEAGVAWTGDGVHP